MSTVVGSVDAQEHVGRSALVSLLRIVFPLTISTAAASLVTDVTHEGLLVSPVRVAIVVVALAIGLASFRLRSPTLVDMAWRHRRPVLAVLVSLAALAIVSAADEAAFLAVAGNLLLAFAVAQVLPEHESRWWYVAMVLAMAAGLVISGASVEALVLSLGTFVFAAGVADDRTRRHVAAVRRGQMAATRDAEAHRLLATITALTDLDERAVLTELVEAVRRLGHDDVAATLGAVHVGAADVHDPSARRWSLNVDLDHARRGTLIATPRPGHAASLDVVTQVVDVARAALRNARVYEEQREVVRRLVSLDSARNDFMSSVSHELRTPLTVVKGLGHTLASGMVPLESPDGRRLLSRIDANAIRLETMLDSLLNLSQVHRRGLDVVPAVFDLGRHVSATVDRLSSLADMHDLRLVVAPDCLVVADAALLDHVLENLLANACKYTPIGSRVTVEVEIVGDDVRVCVADDGPGIDPLEMPLLTERFFRGGTANTRDTSGLGLGLSLVAEILEAHDSRLEISSAAGDGAHFAFVLPRAVSDSG